jgi:hypothetical protein
LSTREYFKYGQFNRKKDAKKSAKTERFSKKKVSDNREKLSKKIRFSKKWGNFVKRTKCTTVTKLQLHKCYFTAPTPKNTEN